MAIVTRRTVKEFLQITSDTYNNMIDMFIPMVEKDFEIIQNRPFDIDSNDDTEYPDNAEYIVSQMIGYNLSNSAFSSKAYGDKKSESIGGYSYTRNAKDDMLKGYPLSIVGKIQRFVNVQ